VEVVVVVCDDIDDAGEEERRAAWKGAGVEEDVDEVVDVEEEPVLVGIRTSTELVRRERKLGRGVY